MRLADARRAGKKLRSVLRDGPRTRDDLIAAIGKDGWFASGLDVQLVRVPPSGTWERRRADLYALAEDWVGPNTATAAEGVELLVRRYLAAFGPARPGDIRNWGRLDADELAAALGRLQLRRFRDENGKELVDLPREQPLISISGSQRAPLPDAQTRVPVRFLPTWDAILLVHARATGVLPEEFRPIIFTSKLPFSMHTFLLDGSVAGAWRYEHGRIELQPFRKLTRAERAELKQEGERLAAFHA